METPREILQKVKETIDDVLCACTGLDSISRKLVIYWTLATHCLDHVKMFPLLLLKGPMGTGKSVTLRIIKVFAYRPVFFSARGSTLPVIRDKLAECNKGTAIIEEADESWKGAQDFEGLLSDRYHQDSAEAALKVSAGDNYVTVTKQIFGATVLHRRKPFTDPALKARSVLILLKANHEKAYREFCENDPLVQEAHEILKDLSLSPIDVPCPVHVAARVWDSYKPLISVAQLCGDEDFLPGIMNRLKSETAALMADQSEEPDALVLRAIIECISMGKQTINFRYVGFREIVESIKRNHLVEMRPQQIGTIVRELGFKTTESHGVTKVVTDAASLLQASVEVGYEDDVIAQVRSGVMRQSSPG